MRNSLTIVVACTLLLFSGNVRADDDRKRPGWIDGNATKQFSAKKYMTSVGSGSTRQEATIDAQNAMASMFRAQVNSELNSKSKSSLTEDTNEKVEGEGSSETSSDINVTTSVKIRGMEIKRHYFDESLEEHYALAVINKMKVKSSYRRELMQMKSKVQALYSGFKKKPEVSSANKILDMVEKFEALNQEYIVVNNGRGMRAPISMGQLNSIRDQFVALQSKHAIALEYTGPKPRLEFQEMITSCLSDQSIAVVLNTKKQDPNFKVFYNIRGQKKFMNVKGWVKFQFSSLAVIKKENVMIGRKRISKTAMGRNKDMAFDMIKEDLSEAVCAQIAKYILR